MVHISHTSITNHCPSEGICLLGVDWKTKMVKTDGPNLTVKPFWKMLQILNGRLGHDRIIVGFITTCAISAYHH